ncbi:MAG: hypothetical protein KJ726_01150 [Verrucomicrobia bacterium]|nr:hypothetical protein [Verrucomicrobiota bacterium]MBU1908637.1 hypothetical protein [Verrucomicrobiota bacterium]
MKFLVGLLFLPFCAAATRTVWHLAPSVAVTSQVSPASVWGLAAGFSLWVVLFLCLPRPVTAYVFAHELTHAVWGWAMGARISRFRVGARGGSVNLSKSNFLITLAPYFFPLYTILVVAAHGLLALFYDMRAYEPLWLGFVGLTWSFHLTFTITTLRQHQPDIRIHGRLFSYALIYLFNLLGIGLGIVAVAPPTLGEFAGHLGSDILQIWESGCRLAHIVWAFLMEHLPSRAAV